MDGAALAAGVAGAARLLEALVVLEAQVAEAVAAVVPAAAPPRQAESVARVALPKL